jgi:uroporphyrinogen-III synthase
MRVLVTRPAGDGDDTAARLAALGHMAILCPLLEIVPRLDPDIALDDVQAILVTSANGIRALAARTSRRDIPVLAVGSQSAAIARALGFVAVDDAKGDAKTLAELAAARLRPDAGVLFHAAGADTRGDLAGRLAAKGFTIRSEVLYEAVAAQALNGDAARALRDGTVDAVLFFSPRTAKIFAELAAPFGADLSQVIACCISAAAAAEIAALGFGEARIAAQPDQQALLDLIA